MAYFTSDSGCLLKLASISTYHKIRPVFFYLYSGDNLLPPPPDENTVFVWGWGGVRGGVPLPRARAPLRFVGETWSAVLDGLASTGPQHHAHRVLRKEGSPGTREGMVFETFSMQTGRIHF